MEQNSWVSVPPGATRQEQHPSTPPQSKRCKVVAVLSSSQGNLLALPFAPSLFTPSSSSYASSLFPSLGCTSTDSLQVCFPHIPLPLSSPAQAPGLTSVALGIYIPPAQPRLQIAPSPHLLTPNPAPAPTPIFHLCQRAPGCI